jgi:hypothetical protein
VVWTGQRLGTSSFQAAKDCHNKKYRESEKNMQQTTTPELSEKARENARRNAEARERNSKYVKLDIGQKRPYLFDLEKVLDPQPGTRDDGTEYTVIPYVVEDERYPGYEKLFNASPQLSEKIDGLLVEGHRRLMVEKEKSGKTGRYNVYPLD